jgi:hypothetical protein
MHDLISEASLVLIESASSLKSYLKKPLILFRGLTNLIVLLSRIRLVNADAMKE